MYYTGIAVYRLDKGNTEDVDLTALGTHIEYRIELIITSEPAKAKRFSKEHKDCKLCLMTMSAEVPGEITDLLNRAKEFLSSKENIGIRIN